MPIDKKIRNARKMENSHGGTNRAITHQPDCLLMDVVMPDMAGFRATRALSNDAQTASIPVIILRSKSQPGDKIWAQPQGVEDDVVKPSHQKELINKITSLLVA